LRRLGLTRQKSAYCIEVAKEMKSGRLDLRRVARASDQHAREQLRMIRGIGPWTADIYLLMALRRPDVWPSGDLALLTSMHHSLGLKRRPSVERADAIAERWSPWRSVAARILWHAYLKENLSRR